MYDIQIGENDLEQINILRNDHSNKQIRKRLLVLYWKAKKLQHQEIQLMAECSSKLVTQTLKSYSQGGLKAILEINRYKRVSELEMHRDRILEAFQKSPPATAQQAAAVIYDLTGVKRGMTQIKTFLHKLGLKPQMTGQIPAKANPEEQEAFKKKLWILF